MIRVATAACVALASVLACGVAYAEPSNAEAAVRFERGKRLYKEGDFKVALIEFTRAYEVSPSYHVLFNIAQVHLQLGSYARAIVTLERYLHDGGDALTAERRQQVAQDLELARTRTASLTIETNVPGAEILVDDVAEGASPLRGHVVDAGQHRITVTRASFVTVSEPVTLASGDDRVVRIVMQRTPERRVVVEKYKDSRFPATVGWIATGTLVAGTFVTALFAASARDRLDDMRSSPGISREDLDSQVTRARGLTVAADILGAAAVLAGGTSLYLTLKPPSNGGSSPAPSAASITFSTQF